MESIQQQQHGPNGPALGGTVFNPLPHTQLETDRCACMHVHKHIEKHHTGKVRQLLGIQYKQPHQTCRQTDDYLHDKDLKYSPQNVFPWSSSTAFHVHLQSKRAGFDIKAIYGLKVWKTPALTAHLPGLSAFFFHLKKWGEQGAEKPCSCLPSRKCT